MSKLVYIGGLSDDNAVAWAKADHDATALPLGHPAPTSLRIKMRPIRMNRRVAWGSSCPVLRAFMEQQRLKRLADRPRQLGIERCFDTALNTTERVHGIRIRHTDHVVRKLVILNELHACSLSLRRAA